MKFLPWPGVSLWQKCGMNLGYHFYWSILTRLLITTSTRLRNFIAYYVIYHYVIDESSGYFQDRSYGAFIKW